MCKLWAFNWEILTDCSDTSPVAALLCFCMFIKLGHSLIHNPGAHAEGYSTWSVCVSVCLAGCQPFCLSVSSNLPSRAITRPTRGTNGISIEK